jgi:hypothetical protein
LPLPRLIKQECRVVQPTLNLILPLIVSLQPVVYWPPLAASHSSKAAEVNAMQSLGIQGVFQGRRYPSDHYPVTASITIPLRVQNKEQVDLRIRWIVKGDRRRKDN